MFVKNWSKFQHYKDRKPPWIKLYRDLLDDPEFHALSGDAAKALILMWLIASESLADGKLPASKTLAFRLRITESELTKISSELHHWLAPCLHDASTLLASETERDSETERERDIFLVPEVENDKTSKDKVQSDKTSKVEKNLFDLGLNSIPTTYDEGYDNRIYPTYQGKADTLSKKVAEIITDLFDEWPQEAVEYSVKNWMYTHRDLTLEEWGKIAREARNVTKHGEIDRQIIKNINAKINTWKINRNEKKTNRVAQAPPCPGYDKEGRWTPRGKVGDREYRMTWWYDDANCNARRNMDIFLEQSPRSRPYLPQEGIDLLNRLIDEHEAAGHPWKIEVGDD